MTTGRINQVTDRRSIGLSWCSAPTGLWELSTAPARAGCGVADDRQALPKGDCLTGLQTSILHSRQGTTGDLFPECNTQERHARRTNCGEHLPFAASNARIQRTAMFSHHCYRQPTRFFDRSFPPAGDVASV